MAISIPDCWLNNPPEEYHVIGGGEQVAFVHNTCVVECRLSIGRFSYISRGSTLGGHYPIQIGSFVSIAENFYCFTSANHQTSFASTSPLRSVVGIPITYPENAAPRQKYVHIGHDVWIGSDVHVMSGAAIGNGCVVAARAVVAKELEPYGIYGGVPARLIRLRFPEKQVEQLMALNWWNWPLSKLRANAAFFSTDLNRFDGSLADLIVE
ncbi:MAG: CatB-related O-acetyltransferase [Magnetococcales bacterium]|nr:CatB-related O-acetyltransferase [Magnetococcales bacterium]